MSADTTEGFILTRRHVEVNRQLLIECWMLTPQGPVRALSEPQKHVCFITHQDTERALVALRQQQIPCRHKYLELQTFEHQTVTALYFDTHNHFYAARDCLKKQHLTLYEDDIRVTERFLMERFVYGAAQIVGRKHADQPYPLYRQCRFRSSTYHPELKVVSLDIECSERGELYCIGMSAGDYQQVWMIGEPEPDIASVTWVKSESELLRTWQQAFGLHDPDIVIGWNVINFDFRVLIKRGEDLNVPLCLGRLGEPAVWRDSRTDSQQGFVDIAGRLVVDGIDALKTATYQFESFSLDFVANALLGEGKATEDPDQRMAEINHNFQHNKAALAKYNVQDCVLVERIFQHTRLLDFLILRSQLTGLELDRSGGSVAAFINLYLPKLHRAGYISPNRPAGGGLASPGGYVMSSVPGLYQHVLVLDFKSLYPSIIRTFKIDPMGLIEGLANPEHAIPGFKDACFDRNKHFLPDIITSLWQQRDEAKRQKDAARSQAIKILMNSFYGVLGSGGCPFYDTRLASSITLRGHDIMQTTAKWITEQGYKVIYGDTDSTFVWLDGDYSVAEAYEVGEQLQTLINQRWQDKLKADSGLECYLEIEFETHFEQFLMPTIRGSEQGSKKRYAGLKTEQRGQAPSSLVFKGLESVRSDWTALARTFQRELYQRVFRHEPVADYVRTVIAQTRDGHWDDALVYRKRLRQRLDKYTKNVPPHVRAARLADEALQAEGKAPRYQNKGWISYVITVNGPEPLECHPSRLDYEHYIDKQLRPIAEAILPFVGESFEQLAGDQLSLF